MPYSWVAQTKPEGLIVTPWGTPYFDGVLIRLRVNNDGTASGRCKGTLAFMKLRAQRLPEWPDDAEPSNPVKTTTDMNTTELHETIGEFNGAFAVGLRVPDCRLYIDQGDRRFLVELYDHKTNSWASATLARELPKIVIRQHGPRTLWDEVEAAHRWWVAQGKPEIERFGLTVTSDSEVVWLDTPDNVLIQEPAGT